MASSADIEGIDELLRNLRTRLNHASERVEKKALKAAGKILADEMERRVVVSDKSYNLHTKMHIVVSNVKKRNGVKYVTIGPGKKVSFRSHFIEFGTSKQSARPFIEPSYHAKKDEALNELAEELRKGLRGT
ncbi:hypothetical protein D3C84_742200 [compost metagenome]